MAATAERPFKFDLERAKKTINSVIGDVIDEDKISKAIDYFMKNHDDIKTADDILYYFKWEGKDFCAANGIDDATKEQIITNISNYEFSPQRIEDGKVDDEYAKSLKSAADGGSRKRHTRKYASKHRKSARRGTKQRKSSRSQLRLRRRRTNKK